MSITIEQLSQYIQAARQQEKKHRDDAAACAGAAQAYEQLLTQLIQAQRAAKEAASMAVMDSAEDVEVTPPLENAEKAE